jgi:hypothetical protein
MIKQFPARRNILIVFLLVFLTHGCTRPGLNAPKVSPTAPDIQPIMTGVRFEPSITPTLPVATPTPVPTETSMPKVTISAEKGNIYIRRGPGMAYDRISVLYMDMSTEVLARDVLSKWVQVVIPDSDKTGWVSLQTDYSKLNGELSSLPDYTFTEWPVPAYLYNCTEHDMYIMPGEITVTSYFTHPNNQVWLNPGRYIVYDDTFSKRPIVKEIDIREGENIAILYDGAGNHHKCP